MTKKFCLVIVLVSLFILPLNPAFAEAAKEGSFDRVSPKTVMAAALSLLAWPGIGQAVNNNNGPKVATHAVLGLTGVFRFWSAYDALVDREGGYWKGKI